MQLNRVARDEAPAAVLAGNSPARIQIRGALAAATGVLLGATAAPSPAAEFDTGVLLYTEFDRVSLVESVIAARRAIGERRFVNATLMIDILTGASPNGALPANRVQTFTSPSGKGWYQVQPGDLPVDHIFQDNRVALDAGVELPVGRLSTGKIGGHFSREYDYQSVAVNGSLSRDFNLRNTQLGLSGSFAWDTSDPEGGPPIPFASMGSPGRPQPRQPGEKSKREADALLGLTQVLSRSTLMQLNYSFERSWGYHNDPFKLITVVAGEEGPDQGEPVDYIYEGRPGTRTKQSLYTEVKHRFPRDVLDISYRFLWDDWGTFSHTVDLRYRWRRDGSRYWQPHLRCYHQTATDFYRHSFVQSAPLPEYASADSRLAEFTALTAGVKYGGATPGGRDYGVRVEYYLQLLDGRPEDALGVQRDYDLIPNLGALIMQFTYSFDTW